MQLPNHRIKWNLVEHAHKRLHTEPIPPKANPPQRANPPPSDPSKKQSNPGIHSQPLLKNCICKDGFFSQLMMAPEVNVSGSLRNIFRLMEFVGKVSLYTGSR